MNDIELMSPLRLSSYRDEKNNTQIFQWVIGEYEASQLKKWESVVSGSSAIIQEITEPVLVKRMYFTVTKNTSASGATLTLGDVPTLTDGGECVRGGDLVFFDVTEQMYESNNLNIYINGVKVSDKKQETEFVSENNIKINQRLQVHDTILFEYQQGV